MKNAAKVALSIVAVVMISAIALSAFAAERHVARVFPSTAQKEFVAGDTVPAPFVLFRLSLDRPCEIPVARAAEMREAKIGRRLACWFPTVDDGFAILYFDGSAQKQELLEALPLATINADGSATIIERGYDSRTWTSKIAREVYDRKARAMREGRY